MEDFEFNSHVHTSIEESKRLLALGLKKETADCRHWAYTKDSKGNPIPKRNQKWFTRIGTDESAQVCGFMVATFIPAWSLHRLMEIAYNGDMLGSVAFNFHARNITDYYELAITVIEYLVRIKEFNKDYLEEEK